MNLRQKAANGVVWSAIQKWGAEGVAFLTFVVLSRLLEPEAFGLVALAMVFTVFVKIFQDQGFGVAIVQRADLEREHLDTAFWISVATGSSLMLAGIAASGLVAAFFQEPQLAPVLRWLSLGIVFGAVSSTQTAILRRNLAFKSLAARSLIATVVGGVVGLSMAFAGFGVWSLVAQNLVMAAVGAVVLWRVSDWRPGFKVSKKHYRDLLPFGMSVLGTNVLRTFIQRADDLLIGYFLGTTLLGYYTIGYRLLLVILRLVTGITNAVAVPILSRIQHEPKRVRRAFYKAIQYTSLLSLPVFVGLAALAPQLIPTVFGERWAPSVPITQVLALAGILQSVLFFNGSTMRACGKPSWEFGIMLLNAVCNVIGFFIAARWGIVAVAASFVIVSYLLAPISYLAVRKLIQIDLKTYLAQFGAPLVASLTMLAIVTGFQHFLAQHTSNVYLQLSVCIAVGVTTYLLVIAITARPLFSQVRDLVTLALPGWKLR